MLPVHDLRHSYASRALALGEGLPMIAKLLATPTSRPRRAALICRANRSARRRNASHGVSPRTFWAKTREILLIDDPCRNYVSLSPGRSQAQMYRLDECRKSEILALRWDDPKHDESFLPDMAANRGGTPCTDVATEPETWISSATLARAAGCSVVVEFVTK